MANSLIALFATILPAPMQNEVTSVRASDIHMRDPWIMAHDGTYYLVGTTGEPWGKSGGGFAGYSSTDLIDWTPHGGVLAEPADPTWARYQFWAPELYEKDGKFTLCYSGNTDDTHRGTGVAASDDPLGPFVNLGAEPLTPLEWECLDGHICRDADGVEWFIFVHEWVQAPVGEMWAQRISADYSELIGEKTLLFKGRDATWSNNVIDGPMVVIEGGKYYCFWSSFNDRDGYCAGYAVADSITGPYTHSAEPVIAADGGHNCIFTGFDGKRYTSFHRTNKSPNERVMIYELLFEDGDWKLGAKVGE
ncbi:MAG TPA: family 43 glycosylhydrolase [Armatimonadota bacterium]|nr:family 43 glycosylhydrolase [Armatimonadota bacterium]